ncbi:hypothetical protein CEXT_40341 [Caerostris extrusa]|uniref:Uncharacterized protein n=1 Tax=Caerostris extrusa TaxID=172846 RepID=A0AAV4YB40_CAEEX|nr:hypothetical protein CEXT_40341 [Caerostris extrusa]
MLPLTTKRFKYRNKNSASLPSHCKFQIRSQKNDWTREHDLQQLFLLFHYSCGINLILGKKLIVFFTFRPRVIITACHEEMIPENGSITHGRWVRCDEIHLSLQTLKKIQLIVNDRHIRDRNDGQWFQMVFIVR